MDNASVERVADPVFGGQISVYQAGPRDAPSVVLVHGIGDNGARDWRSVITDLARDYHVVAVDMPGFATSSKGNHLYAPEQLAVAVHGAIQAYAKPPYNLIGHSLGASVSLAYAQLYGDELQRLILVAVPGVLHRTVYTQYLGEQGAARLQATTPMPADWLTGLIATQLQQLEAGGFNPALLLHSPWARQQLMRGDPKMISAYALAQHDYGPALRDLRVPTLLLWGDLDPLAPLRTAQLLGGVINGARLKVLSGIGHMPMLESPQAFNAVMRDALAGRLENLPAYRLPAVEPTTDRVGRCENKPGMRFTGDYQRINLANCDNAVIEHANVGTVEVSGGSVHLINSHVFDGIKARSSRLQLTAGSVRGEPPLTLAATLVDAAGTRFISDYDVAENLGSTPLIMVFSVAAHNGVVGHSRLLHEVVSVPATSFWP